MQRQEQYNNHIPASQLTDLVIKNSNSVKRPNNQLRASEDERQP